GGAGVGRGGGGTGGAPGGGGGGRGGGPPGGGRDGGGGPPKYAPASPRPVPAATTAMLPAASGAPGETSASSSGPSAVMPHAVASRSLITQARAPSSRASSAASMI